MMHTVLHKANMVVDSEHLEEELAVLQQVFLKNGYQQREIIWVLGKAKGKQNKEEDLGDQRGGNSNIE